MNSVMTLFQKKVSGSYGNAPKPPPPPPPPQQQQQQRQQLPPQPSPILPQPLLSLYPQQSLVRPTLPLPPQSQPPPQQQQP
jgi:hypothetical protein